MYLVFDVGATFVKFALMTGEGEIEEKGSIPTKSKPGDGLEDFVESLGRVYDRYSQRMKLEGIAVGLPGQVDVDNGIVYGGGGLRYMHNVPLRDLLSNRCGCVPVSLENDAKCAALAEVWLGNAKGIQDACVLVFGTGIGGAVIKDRKIHRGKRLQAGEVSFMIDGMKREDIDNLNCIEDFDLYEAIERIPYFWAAHAATGAVCYRLAKRKNLPMEEVTGRRIYQWIKEGDREAVEMMEEMYFSIAKQCCNLYVTFDPEVILIGGGISAEPQFVEGIKRYVERLKKISILYRDIKIDVCRYRNDSNLLGALYNFKQIY